MHLKDRQCDLTKKPLKKEVRRAVIRILYIYTFHLILSIRVCSEDAVHGFFIEKFFENDYFEDKREGSGWNWF
jgi:hypothetical protein